MDKRAFQRHEQKARIQYDLFDSESHVDARMYNTSEGGLCFESEKYVPPGSEIRFHLLEASPEGMEFHAGREYVGEVMWCRKMIRHGEADNTYYGVGCRLMLDNCAQCDKDVGYDNLLKLEDEFLFLCADCFEKYNSLSDGKLKETVTKQLLGNVL